LRPGFAECGSVLLGKGSDDAVRRFEGFSTGLGDRRLSGDTMKETNGFRSVFYALALT